MEVEQRKKLEGLFAQALEALGFPLDDPHLRETPKRIARFYLEFFEMRYPDLKIFPARGVKDWIVATDISFVALCAHHLLPFFGRAVVAYKPKDKVVGASKLARLVEYVARHKPHVQEELTLEIAQELMKQLSPTAVIVYTVATHTCVSIRGIRKEQMALHCHAELGDEAAIREGYSRVAPFIRDQRF